MLGKTVFGLVFVMSGVSAYGFCEYDGKILDSSQTGPKFISSEPENFTGTRTCRTNDGKILKSQTQMVNGKEEGLKIVFNEKTGKKSEEAQMKNGKRNGLFKRYDDKTSKLVCEWTYKDDEQLGLQKDYDRETGRLAKVTVATKDRSDSTELDYNKKGNLVYVRCGIVPIPEDEIICGRKGAGAPTNLYFNDGSHDDLINRIVRYKNMKQQGEQITLNADGSVLSKEIFDNDQRVSLETGDRNFIEKKIGDKTERTINFASGKLRSKEILKGQESLSSEEYYENGKLREKTVYGPKRLVEVESFTDLGAKVCRYRYYQTLSWRLRYEGSHECWYPNGNPLLKYNYVKGEMQDEQITYYENGFIATKLIYDKGILKNSKTFDEAGKLTEDFDYEPDGSRKIKAN